VGLRSSSNLKPIVESALRCGITHFDTSSFHTNLLAERGWDGIPRQNYFLSSKIWIEDIHPLHLHDSVTKELRNLNQDYFDLLSFHFPFHQKRESGESSNELFLEAYRALASQIGTTTKFIGLCNVGEMELKEIVECLKSNFLPPPNVIQVEHSPYVQQKGVISLAHSMGIQCVSYGLFGGHSSRHNEDMQPFLLENPVVQEVAKSESMSEAQALVLWATQKDIAVIPHVTTTERLEEISETRNMSLSPENEKKIDDLWRHSIPSWRREEKYQNFLVPDKPKGKLLRSPFFLSAVGRSATLPRLSIIGNGVLGASLALEAARSAAFSSIQVYEKRTRESFQVPLGHESSVSIRTFSMLNYHQKQQRHYFDLNKEGLERWQEIFRLYGIQGNQWTGCLEWWPKESESMVNLLQARQAYWPENVAFYKEISFEKACTLEPNLNLQPYCDDFHWFYCKTVGSADPWVVMPSLHDLLENLGVEQHFDCSLDSLSSVSDPTDVIILACGEGIPKFFSDGSSNISFVRSPGRLALTSQFSTNSNLPFQSVLLTDTFHARLTRANRVCFGISPPNLDVLKGVESCDLNSTMDQTFEEFKALLPFEHRSIEIEDFVNVDRIIPTGGLPMVGVIPPTRHSFNQVIYAAASHSGWSLAPALANRLITEIRDGKPDSLLSQFSHPE